MTELTYPILAILVGGPIAGVDIWDAIGDPGVRQADVSNELHALCDEGRVARTIDGLYILSAPEEAA